jgi:MFS family permease
VSVSTLTGVLLKLPSGALSDIYGRQFLLRIGVVAFGLPPFLYLFITDLNSLTALRFVHGLATAIFAPSALATVAELYRERRGAALGTYTACTQSGALLGPFIGGYLAHVAGFDFAFVTAGVCGCIAIVLFYSCTWTWRRRGCIRKGCDRCWRRCGRIRDRGAEPQVLITSATVDAKMIANGALMAFLPLYGITVGLNPGSSEAVQCAGRHVILLQADRGASDRMGRQPLIIIDSDLRCHVRLYAACLDFGLLLLLSADSGSAKPWCPRHLPPLSRIVRVQDAGGQNGHGAPSATSATRAGRCWQVS